MWAERSASRRTLYGIGSHLLLRYMYGWCYKMPEPESILRVGRECPTSLVSNSSCAGGFAASNSSSSVRDKPSPEALASRQFCRDRLFRSLHRASATICALFPPDHLGRVHHRPHFSEGRTAGEAGWVVCYVCWPSTN